MPEQAEKNGSLTIREREIVLLAASRTLEQSDRLRAEIIRGYRESAHAQHLSKVGHKNTIGSSYPSSPFGPKNRQRFRAPGGRARLDASKLGALSAPNGVAGLVMRCGNLRGVREPTGARQFCSSSGSLAKFTAKRRASSPISRAGDRFTRCGVRP